MEQPDSIPQLPENAKELEHDEESKENFPSLLSDEVVRRKSKLIRGHSNVEEHLLKIKNLNKIIRTEDQINTDNLQELRLFFEENGDRVASDDFRFKLGEIVGTSGERYGHQISQLIDKIETAEEGFIKWGEFCSYMIRDLEDKNSLLTEYEVPLILVAHAVPTNHKTEIKTITTFANPPRLISLSEDGYLKVWNMKMQPVRHSALFEHEPKYVKVSHAVVMPNACRIAIATTNRDICFYDSSSYVCCEKLRGLDNMISSIDYGYSPSNHDSGVLIFGDYSGYIGVLEFFRASKQLFNDTRPPEKQSRDAEDSYVHISNIHHTLGKKPSVVAFRRHKAHVPNEELDFSVRKVQLMPSLDTFISCSAVSKMALIVRKVSATEGGSVFTIPEGVTVFDYLEETNSIVSGGLDFNLRVWNPHVTAQPSALLKGHNAPITYVMFNSGRDQVISVAMNEVIKIWNLKDQVCINTLTGVIPPNPALDAFPLSSFFWHVGTQSIICARDNEMVVIQLTRNDHSKASKTSHVDQVSCVLAVDRYHQLVSGDRAGKIISWDIGHGGKCLEFSDAHGGSPIAALSHAHHDRYFISAAVDGSIFVWNLLTGASIQRLVKSVPSEVTDLLCAKNIVYTVGWDRKVCRFELHHGADDAYTLPSVTEDPSWRPDTTHQDDITSIDTAADMLATASFDGQIFVWNIRAQRVMSRFDVASFRSSPSVSEPSPVIPPLSAKDSCSVVSVLFLESRAGSAAFRNGATLVSASDGASVFFWNARGGSLFAAMSIRDPSRYDQCVTCLATNKNNYFLYTADSVGYLKVWDISTYCASNRSAAPPPLANQWRAHIKGITGIQIVEVSSTLITASNDFSVRLWTMGGDYVGTFGDKWVLASEPTGSTIALGINLKLPRASMVLDALKTASKSSESSFAALVEESDEAEEGLAPKKASIAADRPEKKRANAKFSMIVNKTISNQIAESLVPQRLGKTYEKTSSSRKAEKMESRRGLPRINMRQGLEPEGLHLCQPFQLLSFTELDSLVPQREPSAIHRNRRRGSNDVPGEETTHARGKDMDMKAFSPSPAPPQSFLPPIKKTSRVTYADAVKH